MTANYKLSFCDIERLSENIFEVIIMEGIVIDDKLAKEVNDFWLQLRDEPFYLLVNNINSFSFSFSGAREIANNPLRKKTAILLNEKTPKSHVETTLQIKKTINCLEDTQCFYTREKALEWLKDDSDTLLV